MICSWGFFLGIMGISISVHGQKIIEKSWDASQFDQVELISEQVYRIEIFSEDSDQIRLETHFDGEYADNMMLSVMEESRTLKLSEQYRPLYKPPNDKLAAHKVISIEMKLYVPERLRVYLSADIGSVIGRGKFSNLQITLSRGFCELYHFEGDGTIVTKEGDITVYAQQGVVAEGVSKYGTVENELSLKGPFFLKAESVKGQIRLLKTPD